jgi:outer membrane protein TolC
MLRVLFVAGVVCLRLATAAADNGSAAQPMSLADALGAAERASESIAIARSDVDRAQSQVISARSGYLPIVNGSAAYQRTLRSEFDDISFGLPPDMMPDGDTGSDVELPFGQRNNWRVGVNVNQPLFDGFRTQHAMGQAYAGVRVSQLGVTAARAQVVLQAALAYYDALLADRQVEIAQVTLQQAEATLAETQLKFKQGTAPEFDVVRAQVSRDNSSNIIVRFTVERDVAYVQLHRLLGVPLDKPITLTTKLEDEDIDAVIATARSAAGLPPSTTRVAIAQAKESIVAREESVSLAKSQYLPTISAGTDLGFVSYQNHPFTTDWKTNWTVGLNISIPLFDGFRRRATVLGSQADLASAKSQLQATSEISQVETAQAQASVEASIKTLEISARTVDQAQRAYQIADLRFQQGASTHLELIDSRVQLEQAQLNKARAAHDLKIARLRQELLPGLPLGSVIGAQPVALPNVGGQ